MQQHYQATLVASCTRPSKVLREKVIIIIVNNSVLWVTLVLQVGHLRTKATIKILTLYRNVIFQQSVCKQIVLSNEN